MADYAQWNEAIIRFYTRNIPKGYPVYLTVNEDAIGMIGRSVLGIINRNDACEDFIRAVNETCTKHIQRRLVVHVDGLEGIDEDSGLPKGVAFLSIMVLAAHKMARNENINGNNYFQRLRQVLGFEDGESGHPPGLDRGAEEPYWKSWGMWLDAHGWLSSAEPGEGPMRFIGYPIGQALLRDDDVAYLRKIFKGNLSEPEALRALDEAQLAGWLLRQRLNRSHLRSGFESSDPDRSSAFFDEAYKVYQGIDWDEGLAGEGAEPIRARKIVAGILFQQSMRGEHTYKLLPRIPAQWQGEQMIAINPAGGQIPLVQYRTGLFRPMWQVDPFMGQRQSFPVEGADSFDEIILPQRRFWILTPDPEDDRGGLATWEKYAALMGKKFRLLVEGGPDGLLALQMQRYSAASLVKWDEGPIDKGRWTEFHGCMVLSASWDSLIPPAAATELHDALKPAMRATIALSKGLRAPGQAAWLEGFPPSVSIYGFENEFTFRVLDGDAVVYERQHAAQSTFSLENCHTPGVYRLEVLWGRQVAAVKALRIIPWEHLESNPMSAEKWQDIGPVLISGARIQPKEFYE